MRHGLTDLVQQVVLRATAPLRARLNAVVSRLVVDAINDSGGFQVLQVSGNADEELPSVEHLQPGGLTHHPVPGAEGLLLCVAGYRDHPIAIGVANRDARPTGLQPGETALYTSSGEAAGPKVVCKADGSVELGGGPGLNPVALANLVDARLAALHTFWGATLTGSAPLTGDALKALYLLTFTTPPATVAASKVKAK